MKRKKKSQAATSSVVAQVVLTILIIEDVLYTAMQIAEALIAQGHNVKIFGLQPQIEELIPWETRRFKYQFSEDTFKFPETAKGACSQLKRIKADLILLDHNLGNICGYSGCELVPSCEGKQVLGISSDPNQLGVNYHWKDKYYFSDTPVADLAKGSTSLLNAIRPFHAAVLAQAA